MTDEQFDDICRGALAFDPGKAKVPAMSTIRVARWNWLPTVPEILACGCACGLVLAIFGVSLTRNSGSTASPNPVVQKAMGASSVALQDSALQVPDAAFQPEASLFMPAGSGASKWQTR